MQTIDIGAELASIRVYLRDWPTVSPPSCETDHLTRLVKCVEGIRSGASGWADVAVLIRQALRVGETAEKNHAVNLAVPQPATGQGHGWPTIEQWRSAGVDAIAAPGGRLLLMATPWTPDWLPSERPVDERVSLAPHPEGNRRGRAKVYADPFLRSAFPHATTDFSTYTSEAHKQAVRAVWACKPGATVIVNLPTGAGKSTVSLAPIFAGDGVSIMVVPTVALALDQERRLKDDLGCDPTMGYAYSGDTPEAERANIRQRIRDGVQRVVIVSPEALTRSLVPALIGAAQLGLLRYFVVDEAHLVDQWGSEFRPEFQAMAGLRAELFRIQQDAGHPGFRTVLMTATMPASTADLLVQLFGKPGPVEAIVANVLRPEPEYWAAHCADEDQRFERVTEALLHLPRPAILYVTKPEEADALLTRLRGEDFQRSSSFTGKTDDAGRRAVLEDFRSGKIDLVVATSAFGLGVDQKDIRTIIHATVPETIDRYYQEVGRAGRDGRTSIAVTCWTNRDLAMAKTMANQRFIGEELGLKRWYSMIQSAERDGDRYLLPVGSLRPGLEYAGDENQRWNVRLLSLLVRSGLLEPQWDRSTHSTSTDDEERTLDVEDLRSQLATLRIAVQVVEVPNEESWAIRVDPCRQQAKASAEKAHELIRSVLADGAPTCSAIASAYELDHSTRLTIDTGLRHPTVNCGRCNGNAEEQQRQASSVPGPLKAYGNSSPQLYRSSLGSPWKLASYDRYTTPNGKAIAMRSLKDSLPALVRAGLRMLLAPRSVLEHESLANILPTLHMAAKDYFFVESVERYDHLTRERLPWVPTLCMFDPGQDIPASWLLDGDDPDDPGVLYLVASDTLDPTPGVPTGRLLRDSFPTMQPLELLVRGLIT